MPSIISASSRRRSRSRSGTRPDQFGQDEDDDDDFAPINDRFASPEPRTYVRAADGFSQPDQQSQQPAAPSPRRAHPRAAMPASRASCRPRRRAKANAGPGGPPGENGEPRRHRDRARAAGRGNGEGGPINGGDPASAPQPDVGELPAFLTAGTTPTAAE